MRVRIHPHSLRKEKIEIPASKSLTHRALIAASLSDGESVLMNPADNRDTQATMRCLERAGAVFEKSGTMLKVRGIRSIMDYDGSELDCGESGSTLRFLIPLFSLCGKRVVFTGHGRLMARPQSVYEQIFHEQNLVFQKTGDKLVIDGGLRAEKYSIAGDVSSQFISGLLFALPLLEKDSSIVIREPYESSSYVHLSEDVLSKAQVFVSDLGLQILIPGSQTYHPFSMKIAGDDSQAVFAAAMCYTAGREIEVRGVEHDSRQGDHAYLSILKEAGALVHPVENGYSFTPSSLHAVCVSLQDCPDLGPMLFALASQMQGTTKFTHCQRLRIKESDRIACMQQELGKLGCALDARGDEVLISGKTAIRGGVELDGHNDHRIVMALAVLAQAAEEPVVINGAEAVTKSWPAFFEDMGMEVDIL